MDIIPIFFSFDEGYVPQAAVTFKSLLTNRTSKCIYKLYVLYTNIKRNSIEMLKKTVYQHPNATLDFIFLDDSIIDIEFNKTNFSTDHLGTVFTKDTLFRCIPDLLPEFNRYDKIIYSDVDIVVVDDISDLYSIKFEKEYIAGVKIPHFLEHEISHLDNKFQGTYIAGGLWVMNLKKMREDEIGKKALEIMKKPPFRLIWNDQDVMNIVCDTNVLFLSYRYISIPDWLPILKNKKFRDKYYSSRELKDCMYRPKIVHYAGKKPWKDITVRKAKLWFDWLDKTDFSYLFMDQKKLLESHKKVSRFIRLLRKIKILRK